jgi:hypothetical protein
MAGPIPAIFFAGTSGRRQAGKAAEDRADSKMYPRDYACKKLNENG